MAYGWFPAHTSDIQFRRETEFAIDDSPGLFESKSVPVCQLFVDRLQESTHERVTCHQSSARQALVFSPISAHTLLAGDSVRRRAGDGSFKA